MVIFDIYWAFPVYLALFDILYTYLFTNPQSTSENWNEYAGGEWLELPNVSRTESGWGVNPGSPVPEPIF